MAMLREDDTDKNNQPAREPPLSTRVFKSSCLYYILTSIAFICKYLCSLTIFFKPSECKNQASESLESFVYGRQCFKLSKIVILMRGRNDE